MSDWAEAIPGYGNKQRASCNSRERFFASSIVARLVEKPMEMPRFDAQRHREDDAPSARPTAITINRSVQLQS
jgi:hypothetical protein